VKLVEYQKRKDVIIFLDTDEHASPFDILIAIDLFPEAQILKYSNVTVEAARKIIQDAMFPRGPEGTRHTKIFVGGYDVKKAMEILEIAKKSMFPPFELAIIIDPKGAFSTASAAVAKTLALSIQKGLGDFKDKTVTVLAGTGPVGQVAARLYASEGAQVIISSRALEKSTAVATKINEELGEEKARGVEAATPEEIGLAIQDSHVILAAGAAGVQLLPLDILQKYGRKCKIVADINAVPPLGIEGLKSNAENVEVLPGIWGIGALAIGTFKNKVEAKIFKQAMEASKGIFDYKVAYKTAKSMVLEKLQSFP